MRTVQPFRPFLCLPLVFLAYGCGSTGSEGASLGGTESGGSDAASTGSPSTGSPSTGSPSTGSPSTGSPSTGAAADMGSGGPSGGNGSSFQLTAGVWDDNRNYDFFQAYLAALGPTPGELGLTRAEQDAAHALPAPGARARLDVALVLDTTGSMGDEISYLRSELAAIAAAVQQRFPDAAQRWSVVLYRDDGDDYVTKVSALSADVAAAQAALDAASAGGGGDFPEAPDQGLEQASQLAWRSDGDVARLVFWVADAPHHVQNAARMAGAVRALAQSGVHVYPVAASGIDGLSERTMRQTAQLTGGRYVFLTDDSGIGGAHAEPVIPCYFVTKLERAISRMISIELSGVYAEPEAADVIREGGDPENGRCTLAGEQIALAF